jgi:hypothetical protein
MDFVYVLLFGGEWEDAVIFLSKEDAIKQSIKYPKNRVEIFSKTDTSGYNPTYNFYRNGPLVQNT